MTNTPVGSMSREFSEGQEIFGYRVQHVTPLETLQCVMTQLEHRETGAKHIHLANADTENVFGAVFKTVPRDSTGVAHILEHTVLCGSRKYPVRDPFFSMLKRSLSTFMNAFTASDWTMYPFATQNEKDYYHLMSVYLDAAFFPLLDEASFQQEGHRLSLVQDPQNPNSCDLLYKGVVYNEMKGAMSSPSQVMARSLLNALYPDTTYRFNSGGEPSAIPRLTWNDLREFHRNHYHPSNAWFFTYGNLPLKNHLEFISRTVLDHFTRIQPNTEVPSQPRWDTPRTASYPYALNHAEDISRKYQVCIAWLLSDIQDIYEVLSLALLNDILLGNAASPLRKNLIDSGLGSSLSDGSGFDADNRDTLFACGLKDVRQEDAEAIERIILETLTDLAENGIEPDLVESALHQIEFHRKEVTNTPYPYGLRLLLGLTATWIHGGDPVRLLDIDPDIETLRRQALQESLLENLIRRFFLENPHRVRLMLVPDPELAKQESDRELAELLRIRTGLTPEQMEKIRKAEMELEQRQDRTEDTSCLPTLKREDIPPDIPVIVPAYQRPCPFTRSYERPTSGILYTTLAMGSGMLTEDQLPLVPFFCHCFPRIGTASHDYVELSRRIDRYTGGLGISPQVRTGFDISASCLPLLLFQAKCLNRNLNPMTDLISELLAEIQFQDLGRLKNLLLEYRAGMESMIVEIGHRLAISLASRRFSQANALSEIWAGVHQYQFIRSLTDHLSDDSLQHLAARLSAIAARIFHRDNIRTALIGEPGPLDQMRDFPEGLFRILPGSGTPGFFPPSLSWQGNPPREGWTTDTSVSFVALSFPTVRMDHEDAPTLALAAKMLRSLYLHREIREKGGAYGGFSLYGAEDGLFSFGSYRDPHIASTLVVYRNAMAFLRSGNYTEENIQEAVLQVCADIDRPDSPGQAAQKAFLRELVGLSDDLRKSFKQRLLGINREDVIRIADRYFNPDEKATGTAVISNETRLTESVSSADGGLSLSIHRI
jgi:Zn-dependent M16 (insulinase) family peptidase